MYITTLVAVLVQIVKKSFESHVEVKRKSGFQGRLYGFEKSRGPFLKAYSS